MKLMVGHNLESIGFYTLSDYRAMTASASSQLQRCELLITDRCNFKCLYCRGTIHKGDIPYEKAINILDYWISEGLRNVRFTGGEPTLHPDLPSFVNHCKKYDVKRIAISTNGTADLNYYKMLINYGVNDFSISLDGGCCSTGDIMSGGIKGAWDKVVENIRELSPMTYVTVGMVFTEQNINECVNAVLFADSLGVADIRVIPSAQYNQALNKLVNLDNELLSRHPILKYRIENIRKGKPIRGLSQTDYHRCPLVLDDMAIAGDYHYPCVIYMREQGNPIGRITNQMRQERALWYETHNTYLDPICKVNCLDVCVDYNNKWREYQVDSK